MFKPNTTRRPKALLGRLVPAPSEDTHMPEDNTVDFAEAPDALHCALAPIITEASVSVPTLLTPAKAAEVLGVGVKTLERWRSQGDGPQFVKLSASTVRYRAVDLNAFVIQRLKSNTLQ